MRPPIIKIEEDASDSVSRNSRHAQIFAVRCPGVHNRQNGQLAPQAACRSFYCVHDLWTQRGGRDPGRKHRVAIGIVLFHKVDFDLRVAHYSDEGLLDLAGILSWQYSAI